MDAQQIITEINRLPLHERRQIIQAIDVEESNINEAELEQKVLRRLLAKGVINEIAAPMTDEEDDEFQPIEIAGEPLSEMIMRERR